MQNGKLKNEHIWEEKNYENKQENEYIYCTRLHFGYFSLTNGAISP